MNTKIIDLFCGAGGLTRGLLDSGLSVVAGIDFEPYCKYAYERNNGAQFINKKIEDIAARELECFYEGADVRVLAGCAPCQPFSKYTQAIDKKNDKKWPLLYEFARLIRDLKPEIVTMENVPEVTKHKVYNDFKYALEAEGYFVTEYKVDCSKYGIPQKRQRQVLFASLFAPIQLIQPPQGTIVTVSDAIRHIPPIKDGEVHPDDFLHRSSKLSKLNKKRIYHSKPGGTWKDWPEELKLECHSKKTGKGYSSVYGRMEWDKPSPTITTLCYGYGNGRFGHPDQDRALSLREASLLQTFPRDYEFCEPSEFNMSAVGKMIGNAVPVKLGEIIGLSILQAL